MQNLSLRSCFARVLRSPSRQPVADHEHRRTRPFCRRLTPEFVSGKGPLAKVILSPGSGRRVLAAQAGNVKTNPIPTRRRTPLPPTSCSTQHPFPIQAGRNRFTPCPSRPGCPKRMPRKIRNVRPVRCQGAAGSGSAFQPLYGAFMNWLPHLYCPRRRLDTSSFLVRMDRRCLRESKERCRTLGGGIQTRFAPAGSGRHCDLVHDLGSLELVERRETLKLRRSLGLPTFVNSPAWNSRSSKFGDVPNRHPVAALLRRVRIGRLSFVIRVFHQHR